MSPYKALILICEVLSYTSNTESLNSFLKKEPIDWELIVKITSKHLILPTFYDRLNDKQLVQHLPEDLDNYLKEITYLNHQRNQTLLKEVHQLSSILKAHHIDHVFLKGAAMIASNKYTNNAQRMVGDIDILVANEQLKTAFELIKKQHYTPVEQTLGATYFEHKHLSRLIPENAMMAVEVHKKLLKKNSSIYLNSQDVLSRKTITETGVYVPDDNNLIKHLIYNYQINDDGHYYGNISLRSLFDAITLIKENKALSVKSSKYTKSFFSMGSVLFNDLKPYNTSQQTFKENHFLFRLKNKTYNAIYHKILSLFLKLKVLLSRAGFFIINSNYRKDVFKDRNRILTYIIKGKTNKK